MRTPYFRKDRNAWYVVINGRRARLDADKATAYSKWKELQVSTSDMAVSVAVQRFLDRPRKASTQKFYAHHLKLFLGQVETLKVSNLKAHHLTDLLDRFAGNYRHNICRCVKTAFKWLVDSEHVARNPFLNVKTPPATARGDEAYIPPETWTKIIGRVNGDLLDILTILRETGCRPKEARQLEARHLGNQCAVLPKSESKGGRTQRVIHLSDSAHAILRRLAVKYPTGPLLRNGSRPWTAQCLANRCARLGFNPYQLRHSWATDAILRGVDLVSIATLLGHADLKMLNRVYAHVQKCDGHLQESLRRAIA